MAIGIQAVSYYVPDEVRRNDYWLQNYPELVENAAQQSLARLWKKSDHRTPNTFDRVMAPYLEDPFRGAVERRVLATGQTGLDMEIRAAKDALAAADMPVSDVELILVSSFLPDQFGPGNAAYLVRALGASCPAINLESACSSALVALNTAVALIHAGQYKNVLVVTSCSYTRIAPETDSMSWFMGDGAGALLVGELEHGRGWLSQHTIDTSSSCGTFRIDLVHDPELGPVPRIAASKQTARVINELGEPAMRSACFGALEKAGLTLDDIACFVVNTPTAWYADFASQALGFSRHKIVSTYRNFANTGTALLPINLHTSVRAGRLVPGDLILMYAIGSVSTAVATVMQWGHAALGPSYLAEQALGALVNDRHDEAPMNCLSTN